MSEMALTADHLIVIGRGRILAQGPVNEVIAGATSDVVRVVSPHASELAEALAAEGVTVQPDGDHGLMTTTAPASRIGEVAARRGLVLHELHTQHASLEDAYLELTGDAVEYRTGSADAQAPTAPTTH